VRSKREGTTLQASLSDYLTKQGSDVKCEETEKYVGRWDIEKRNSERKLSKLEMLTAKMDEKDMVDEYKKCIVQSVWAAVGAISAMGISGIPNYHSLNIYRIGKVG
jgi:hypothetical protein